MAQQTVSKFLLAFRALPERERSIMQQYLFTNDGLPKIADRFEIDVNEAMEIVNELQGEARYLRVDSRNLLRRKEEKWQEQSYSSISSSWTRSGTRTAT